MALGGIWQCIQESDVVLSQKHFAQYGGIASVLGVFCRSAFYIASFTIDSVTYHYDAFWTIFEQLLSDDPKSPRALSILKSVLAESHCSASYIISSTIDSFTHHHDALWTILEQPLRGDPKTSHAIRILKPVFAESHRNASYILSSIIDSVTHRHDTFWTILEQSPHDDPKTSHAVSMIKSVFVETHRIVPISVVPFAAPFITMTPFGLSSSSYCTISGLHSLSSRRTWAALYLAWVALTTAFVRKTSLASRSTFGWSSSCSCCALALLWHIVPGRH